MNLYRRVMDMDTVVWLWSASKARVRKFKSSSPCGSQYVRLATPAEMVEHGKTALRIP